MEWCSVATATCIVTFKIILMNNSLVCIYITSQIIARKVIYLNLFSLHLLLAKRKFNIIRLEPSLQLPVQSVFYKFQLYEFGLSI